MLPTWLEGDFSNLVTTKDGLGNFNIDGPETLLISIMSCLSISFGPFPCEFNGYLVSPQGARKYHTLGVKISLAKDILNLILNVY